MCFEGDMIIFFLIIFQFFNLKKIKTYPPLLKNWEEWELIDAAKVNSIQVFRISVLACF